MKQISNILSGIGRALPYITSPYNLVNICILCVYTALRSVSPSGYSMNIVVTTVLMVFARTSRSSNSPDVISGSLFLAKAAAIVDAYFSTDNIAIFWGLIAVIVSVWIMIPDDMRYRGKASRVYEITSVSDWKSAIAKNAFIAFMDPASSACAEYASVHAELSACSNGETEFFIVNVKQYPDIAKSANLHFNNQPVVVKYIDGKEGWRLPSESTKAPQAKTSANDSLERRFWYNSVKAYFSL